MRHHAIDPDLLMKAYRMGIFPMADGRDDPRTFWVEPHHRAILPLDGFRLSHSLARTLRRERFRVTCNAAFADVLTACAEPHGDRQETWMNSPIRDAAMTLHRRGFAHSIECWSGDQLVGGLYGIGFDGVFCGESMFSRERDASKVALAWLVAALRRGGAMLLDCQFMTEHLASLGAVEITQAEYLCLLDEAQAGSGGEAAGDEVAVGGFGTAGLVAASGDAVDAGVAAWAGAALPAGFVVLLADAEGSSSSPGKVIAQSLTQTS